MSTQFDYTRRVWADLTANPTASIREVCERAGVHHEAAQAAIYELESRGYIRRDPLTARGRQVLVPMISEFVIHERPNA
jgi:DNA-binding MarR family transcriptional regulator